MSVTPVLLNTLHPIGGALSNNLVSAGVGSFSNVHASSLEVAGGASLGNMSVSTLAVSAASLSNATVYGTVSVATVAAGAVSAGTLAASAASLSNATVYGTVSAGSVSTPAASLSNLTVYGATATGSLSAGSATVSGQVSAGSLSVGSATVSGQVSAGSVIAPNASLSNAIVYGTVSANVIMASNLYVPGTTTTVDALTTVASNLVISNQIGFGPALSVSQKGTGSQYAVAEFFDTDISTTVPALMVANGGLVGVGTAAPASALSVSGGATVGSGYAGTAAPIDGLIVSGNVGIGTTAPAQTLDVLGTAQAYGVVSTGPYVAFDGSATNKAAFLDWLSLATKTPAKSWWSEAATPRYSTIAGAPGNGAYFGGVLLPDGRVVFVPHYATTIGILSGFPRPPAELCYHPCFNKF